jgi:acetolactate synthase-1/2/3 large subunit
MRISFNGKINVAEFTVKMLEQLGIKYVLIQPGSQILPILNYLGLSSSLTKIGIISEFGGAVMADVIGRLTKNPPVLLTTAGPGATNTITGIAQAYTSNSPLIHISATLASNSPVEAFHGVDNPRFLEEMFSYVTKYSGRVENPEDLPNVFLKAYQASMQDRMGPSHIGIVDKILNIEHNYNVNLYIIESKNNIFIPDLKTIYEKILNSRCPMIYVGKNSIRASAESEVEELAKMIKALVIAPRHYPDSYPNNSKEYLGTIGEFSNPIALMALSVADLVISIGIRVGSLEDINLKKYYKGDIIYIDIEFPEKKNIMGAFGNIKSIIKEIYEKFYYNKFKSKCYYDFINKVKDLRRKIEEDMYNELNSSLSVTPINPGIVIKELNNLIKDDAIILGDAGLVGGAWLNDLFVFKTPGTFLHSRNYDGMGFAVPGSIAASLVRKDSQVIAITGDGSFLLSSSELPLINSLHLKPKIFVFNDSRLGMIWQEQIEKGYPTIATNLPSVNISTIANGMGIDSIQIKSTSNLKETLKNILNNDKPIVVEIISNSEFKPPSRQIWVKYLR